MRTQPGFRDWLYPEQPHVSCSEKMQRAQTINSFATDDTILEVVSNAAGATPPHWPAKASPAQVSRIPGPHLTQTLQFYQLPTRRPYCRQSTQGVDASGRTSICSSTLAESLDYIFGPHILQPPACSQPGWPAHVQ